MQARQITLVRRPALATALILMAGALPSACNRTDPHQSAIAAGSARLQATSGGAFANAYTAKNYKEVIAITKPVASSDDKSVQSAAAASLVGTAQLGQSIALLDEAAELEHTAVNAASLIRVQFDNWVAYNISADAAQGFDPAPLLERIATDRAASDRELQSQQSKLQEIERKLADLRSRAKAKFEEADKYSLEFSKARESLASLSASEAETQLSNARSERRKGDAVRVEASRLQAQADVTQPEADELKVLIAATQNRIASLDREKLEISERAQQGRAASAQSRTAAAETAKQIETAITELASARSAGVIAKYDEAIAALRGAATSAKAASTDNSVIGKILVGRTQLALAGALAAKASSVKSYASFLHQAIALVPPLPFAASLATPQKEAAELLQRTTEESKAAFEAAQSAFSSIQLRGQGAAAIKDRLTQVSEAIGTLAGKSASEQAAPAAQPDQPSTTTPNPEAAPASESPSAQGPEAAWEKIFAAMESGDQTAVMSFIQIDDPAHESVVRAIVLMGGAQQKLDDACKAKFGKAFSEVQAQAMGITAPTKASDFHIEASGDTATISHPGTPDMVMKNHDGKWLISSASFAQSPAAAAAPMAGAISAAFESVAADVQNGKITSIEEVTTEVQKRASAALKPGGG